MFWCVFSGGKDAPEKTVTIKSYPLKQLDSALQGALAELLNGGDFEGKPGTASKAIRVGGAGPKYVAMLGLGKAEDLAKEAKWGASPYQVQVVFMRAGPGGWGLRCVYADGSVQAGHKSVISRSCTAHMHMTRHP